MKTSDYFATAKRPGPLAVKVDDIVQYTKYFLKQMGYPATDPAWRLEGKVTEIVEDGAFKGWPKVLWLGRDEPILVNSSNLCFPGANLRRLE